MDTKDSITAIEPSTAKNVLPGTHIRLSPITYGAFAIGGWFWGGADEGDAVKAIETAVDNGVTTIDTAPVYGMATANPLWVKR